MLLAGAFYEKIALSHMGFPDFTVLHTYGDFRRVEGNKYLIPTVEII